MDNVALKPGHIADMYHEGTKTFYEVEVKRALTYEEVMGPEVEDGPWAEGWEERSGQCSSS